MAGREINSLATIQSNDVSLGKALLAPTFQPMLRSTMKGPLNLSLSLNLLRV